MKIILIRHLRKYYNNKKSVIKLKINAKSFKTIIKSKIKIRYKNKDY